MTVEARTAKRAAPSWLEASLWMLLLGTLFFTVYGATQWVTSLRPSVPSLNFAWEDAIPFVPAMILPYMSLDFFFAGAVFLCRDRRELHTLACRIVFAIGLSGLCFLLWPLRLAFPRPEVAGLFGWLFELLNAFDLPFNEAPSLHVSLLLILWMHYARRCSGLQKWLLHIWFALIGLSPLLTYQHHIIDVIGGLVVAGLAFAFFPDAGRGSSPHELARRRIGARYLAAALGLALLAAIWPPVSLILLWPALSLAWVWLAYERLGPRAFAKRDGRIQPILRLLLAPYFLGAALSLRLHTRREAPYGEVCPGLLVGRRLNAAEVREAVDGGVVAVLDLTAEFSEAAPFGALPYLNLPVLDLTAPAPVQLAAAHHFIEAHIGRGKVYVHCALGYGRSACFAAAWLIGRGEAVGVDEALAMIQAARPRTTLNAGQRAVLRSYCADPATGGEGYPRVPHKTTSLDAVRCLPAPLL